MQDLTYHHLEIGLAVAVIRNACWAKSNFELECTPKSESCTGSATGFGSTLKDCAAVFVND